MNTWQSGEQRYPGGDARALNITEAGLVTTNIACLHRIVVIAAGGSGVTRLHDCLSVGAADASNLLYQSAFNAANWRAGAVIELGAPVVDGLVVSTLAVGAVLALYFRRPDPDDDSRATFDWAEAA